LCPGQAPSCLTRVSAGLPLQRHQPRLPAGLRTTCRASPARVNCRRAPRPGPDPAQARVTSDRGSRRRSAARRPACSRGPHIPRGGSGSGGEILRSSERGVRLWRPEVVRRSVPHGQEARGMPTRDPFLRVRAPSRRAPGTGSISRDGVPSLRKGSRRPPHRPSAELPDLWLTVRRL